MLRKKSDLMRQEENNNPIQAWVDESKSSPTLRPCLTAWTIISTTVVVFPVPGGPWMTAMSFWQRANLTASLWEGSKDGLQKVITTTFTPLILNILILTGFRVPKIYLLILRYKSLYAVKSQSSHQKKCSDVNVMKLCPKFQCKSMDYYDNEPAKLF